LSAETIAASGYAAFLVVVALGLDRLGRHAHHRSGRFRTNGFTYRPEVDLWVCPEGEHLRPFAVDHHRRVARYRARPVVCNACPAKEGCTDSDEGREIVRPIDPWPHSEAGRFHRGISVVLLALASLIAAIGLFLGATTAGTALLGLTLLASAGAGLRMYRGLIAMPSGWRSETPSPPRLPGLRP
jgi:hypothetical protein